MTDHVDGSGYIHASANAGDLGAIAHALATMPAPMAGEVRVSCCRSCGMAELSPAVMAADTWAVLVDMDGRTNPREFSDAGEIKQTGVALCWGGDGAAIVAHLRSALGPRFRVAGGDDPKTTISVRADYAYRGHNDG